METNVLRLCLLTPFLMKNGYELIVSNEELFHTCIKVAKGDLSEEQLEEWLKNNSYPIDE